jgi:hypothetical protein
VRAAIEAWDLGRLGKPIKAEFQWTAALSPAHLAYLRQLPFTISLPSHSAIVVHAGLVPGVPLNLQDPLMMVSMRSLKALGEGKYEPSEGSPQGFLPWAQVWSGPAHVYFGHDAKRRLQQHPFATGLDTGAVYGGQLSASILTTGRSGRAELVQVAANAEHCRPSDSVRQAGDHARLLGQYVPMAMGVIVLALCTMTLCRRLGKSPHKTQ